MECHEFNKIAGMDCEPAMYIKEVKPTYMCFNWLEKKEIAIMYWGLKKGAYGLWVRANNLYKEKLFLDEMIEGLRKMGYERSAEDYLKVWVNKGERLKIEIKAMMAQ